MTTRLGFAVALASLLATTTVTAMKPTKPDCSSFVPAVQAAADASSCSCADATNHGQYVRCVVGAMKDLAHSGGLPKNCRGEILRGFAKSTCGRSGDVVTCCVMHDGAPRCTVKNAKACAHVGVPGTSPTCADACTSSPSGAFLD
jgi:hypothetical protein